LDVRLIRNLQQARNEQKKQAAVDRWRLLERYRPQSILDIGANEGQFARLIREIFPDAKLYSFEPLGDCFAKVDAYLKEFGPGKAFPVAIGAENTSSRIHRSAFSPSSSLLKMGKLHAEEFPQTAETRYEDIQVRRLDDVASELSIEPPCIVKIDVQGFENQLIEGGRKTLANAHAVVMELSSYELYQDQSTFESVFPEMHSLGYLFRGVIDQMRSPRDGRILQFDALFENERLVDTGSGSSLASPVMLSSSP
jgi:FkbM family methyltransferase